MPPPMKTTGRSVALVIVLLVSSACTGDAPEPDGTGPTGPTADTGPTPAVTFTPGEAVYTYANAGLRVTLDVDGVSGVLEVDNGTENELGRPDLYVLDAVDGHEIALAVDASEPIPAGETASFEVSLDGVDLDRIGLLILLLGRDNYGAFVRTG